MTLEDFEADGRVHCPGSGGRISRPRDEDVPGVHDGLVRRQHDRVDRRDEDQRIDSLIVTLFRNKILLCYVFLKQKIRFTFSVMRQASASLPSSRSAVSNVQTLTVLSYDEEMMKSLVHRSLRVRNNHILKRESLLSPLGSLLLNSRRVAFKNEQALAGRHVPFSDGGVGTSGYDIGVDYCHTIDVARVASSKEI